MLQHCHYLSPARQPVAGPAPPSCLVQTAPETSSLGQLSRLFAVAVVAGGIALRLLYLDADPYYYAWNGYITDEGRWVAHARALALFHSLSSVGWALHLMLAPLYQAATYVMFKLFDVSLQTSRLFSALCGSALLLTFWASLRRSVSHEALLLTVGMLAFEMDLVVLSRIAVPEMPVMVFELAAYFLIASERASSWRCFLAGLLMAGAVGMKATALPVVGIFAVILFLRPLVTPDQPSRRSVVAPFAAGAALPLLIAGMLFLGCCYRELPPLGTSLRIVRPFLALATPHMILSVPFDDDFAPTLAIWGLGVWLSLLAWLALPPRDRCDDHARRLLAAAAIWTILYGSMMLALEYFPSRYKVHMLIPMAVVIAVGVSRIQAGGLVAVDAWLAALRGRSRWAALALLALPTTILAAPLLDPSRLRVKLTCVALALPCTALLLHHLLARWRALSFFVLFPIVGGLAWLFVQRFSASPPLFWPTSAAEGRTVWWPLLLAGTGALTGLLLAYGQRWGRRARAVGVVAVAVGYMTLGLVRLAPAYLDPHFSMRQASHDLSLLLAVSDRDIGTSEAEGLFNGNTLPYRSILGDRWPPARPEVIVIAFKFDDSQRLLEREYRQIRSYQIYVSPEYVRNEDPWIPASEATHISVRVYRRIATGG